MTTLARLLAKGAVAIAAIALAAILCLVVAQVLMRFGLGRPLPWPDELGRLCFIYLVFIGAAEASAVRGHIAVDMVDTFGLSRRVDAALEVIRDLIVLAVLVIVVWGAAQMIPVVHSMKLPATGIRTSWMVLPVLIGGALMAAATLLWLVARVTGHDLPRGGDQMDEAV